MKPTSKTSPTVEIKTILFLLSFKFLLNLFPLNSRAIFYPGKTAGYARKNDVCNHFAKIDYLDIKICLAKLIKNQTSTTSTLTSFVTEALCPTAGSAGVSFNTASSVVGSIRFFRLGLHLHQNR